jgi:hypothetical protein
LGEHTIVNLHTTDRRVISGEGDMIRRRLLAVLLATVVVGCSRGVATESGAGAGALSIDLPRTGSVITTPTVEVVGRAPAGSRIVRDISLAPDDDVIADTDGRWSMTVELEEGANELVFRIGDDGSTEVRLGLTYRPTTAASDLPAAPSDVAPTHHSEPPAEPSPQPPVVTPEPTPEPTPAPPTAPPVVTFGDGTLLVGEDVKPGTYRLREPADFCYWARLKGFGGTLDEIIANDNVMGYGVVTIGKSDAGFESRGCGEWSADLSRVTAGTHRMDVDGTYIVGTDISAGTWRSTGGEFCYWARLSGFGGTLNDIIANNNVFGGPSVVTIGRSDKGFVTRGCGEWRHS